MGTSQRELVNREKNYRIGLDRLNSFIELLQKRVDDWDELEKLSEENAKIETNIERKVHKFLDATCDVSLRFSLAEMFSTETS